MIRLSDENIIRAALNIYNEHLKKIDDQTPIITGTHERVKEMINDKTDDNGFYPHFRG